MYYYGGAVFTSNTDIYASSLKKKSIVFFAYVEIKQ